MAPFELVIDGTDGAGKTPLVTYLIDTIVARGLSVATLAPYRVQEVYPLWESDPLAAATIITGIMRHFREHNSGADVIIWDRGWPTGFVSTTSTEARQLFTPFPNLTLLLLNHEQTTINKMAQQQRSEQWYIDQELRQRYQAAYRRLPGEVSAAILAYEADADGRFLFGQIEQRVMKTLEVSL